MSEQVTAKELRATYLPQSGCDNPGYERENVNDMIASAADTIERLEPRVRELEALLDRSEHRRRCQRRQLHQLERLHKVSKHNAMAADAAVAANDALKARVRELEALLDGVVVAVAQEAATGCECSHDRY